MNKFEQLIEYVINDDEAKARELFHDIVVEKSRAIYEEMMDDEEVEESYEEEEESIEENMDGQLGGDQSDDLIDDIETEESGISMEDDEMGDEFGADDDGFADEMGGDDMGEGGLEDRVVDLEDKLDELMAEFEAIMGDNGDDSVGDEMGGDDLEMDDTETSEFDMDDGEEEESDSEEIEMGMMEAVSLAKVAPAKMGDDGANTKSVVPQNSGAKGMQGSPVKMTGDTAKGRSAPSVKEQPGYQGNGHYGNPGAAPKPVTTQAAGVNTKSPV
jgi:hypothetical protein